jgi:kynurenine formamidase
MLLTHPTLKSVCTSIAGYASLNYRLSPHPSFPQSKSKTSAYEMRNARHPDHINDVLTALRDLQRRHGFGERYLLCGHGCGATMALQVAMGRRWTESGPLRESQDDVVPPLAILGIDGLYDLPLARDTYKDDPFYQRFLEGAFGKNEDDWARASPARWTRYAESWGKGSLVVLAHSHDDELVDWGQVEAMDRCWREMQEGEGDGKANGKLAEMRVMEIEGRHAEIWQKGIGMAGPIGNAVSLMLRMENGDA